MPPRSTQQSPAVVRRKSAPEHTADLLREQITAGELEPGTRIGVEKLSQSIGVSANTLREALQLLEHERLVNQELNRGIFVARITEAGIRDLYTMRRLLELGTLRDAQTVPPEALSAMRAAVALGDQAITEQDWSASSRATTDFHSALILIGRSERATVTMKQLMAELRLTISSVREAMQLRSQFQEDRRAILARVEQGHFEAAAGLLADYLDKGEHAMVDWHRQLSGNAS
ncbi:GntR family transcriptional regulator [Streptomyces malaysiensis]|uniref:GntR family transcriptional regulator n=1 Tax=Streptomyces malaysiensis subsp. samsunensis TaxID=459658 RepID=A0A9X2RUW7_STRMQ|nr:GntR family transcriptional regulator [Streptomyces samsunensis]MCQ8831283.1 GntR family transcriptional regulator [Streptomyces samsunensis]